MQMRFDRRRFLVMAGCLAVGYEAQAADARSVPWSTGTNGPTTAVPRHLTDCHHHIYDGRFPVAAGVASKPADATASDYMKLAGRLGIERHVAVQPSAYGVDNSCLVDALKQFGPTARGIAVVDTAVTDDQLKALNAAGVRGIRFNFAPAGATTPAMIAPLAERIAPLGWHIQLHAAADTIVGLADTLSALPCPLVIDHFAHVPHPAGVEHPVFALAKRLLDNGRTWVKFSAFYADTRVGAPTYVDVGVVAKAYLAANPDHVVWGTDWPHPSEPADRKPDDALLLDVLAGWVGDPKLLQKILVDNPAALYGF